MKSFTCYEKARSPGYFGFECRVQFHFIEGYTPLW